MSLITCGPRATGLSLVWNAAGRELLLALCYDLWLDHDWKARCTLRRRTHTEDFAWPPRIADVLPGVVALWRDVADRVNIRRWGAFQ